MVTEAYLIKRIEMLQKELESLKKIILKDAAKKPVQLRGIWKGTEFSDEEIEAAKSAWLKGLEE